MQRFPQLEAVGPALSPAIGAALVQPNDDALAR
jgi:hypothetical protein